MNRKEIIKDITAMVFGWPIGYIIETGIIYFIENPLNCIQVLIPATVILFIVALLIKIFSIK